MSDYSKANMYVNYEEIIQKQAAEISELKKEIMRKSDNESAAIFHNDCDDLGKEVIKLREKCLLLSIENEKLREDLNTLVSSKSWRATQGLRNFFWHFKKSSSEVVKNNGEVRL